MTDQKINLEKHFNETGQFFNQLADKLGHPVEQRRILTAFKAIIWTIRDRITISESFDLMAQLPIFLRGLYADQWKYSEKPPLDYDTIEEMKTAIKAHQENMGETDFDWTIGIEEIVKISVECLSSYLAEGQLNHIQDQLPKEVKDLVDH